MFLLKPRIRSLQNRKTFNVNAKYKDIAIKIYCICNGNPLITGFQ